MRSISAWTRRSTMRRKVLVEPGLEHRPQHLLHGLLEASGRVRHRQGLQAAERARDGGIRGARQERTIGFGEIGVGTMADGRARGAGGIGFVTLSDRLVG